MELKGPQRRVLEYVSEHDRVTIFELDKAMDAPREEFRRAYQQLHELDFITGVVGPPVGG